MVCPGAVLARIPLIPAPRLWLSAWPSHQTRLLDPVKALAQVAARRV